MLLGCKQVDWIAKNPARAVNAPKSKDKPTLPFSKPEMQRTLVRAIATEATRTGCAPSCSPCGTRMRIADTIALDEKRLNGRKLMLYAAKTGTPSVPSAGLYS